MAFYHKDVENMASVLGISRNIIKPSPRMVKAALNQAAANPIQNAEIIADLTQLRNDCSISILDKGDGRYAIASYYMDLPYYNISLMVETSDDVVALVSDLILHHPELRDQPIYGLYDRKTSEIIESNFEVTRNIRELKMTVDYNTVTNIEFDTELYRMERLTTNDIIQISHLYSIVPAMEWTPKALEFGPYFGIYSAENLVSIAGVQFMTELVAEIGNVVTHFKHRRRNLAYATTKAVMDAIAGRTRNPFLCVNGDNEPAILLYEKMGFVKYQDLYLLQYYF